MPSDLTRRHMRAQRQLQERTAAAMRKAWVGMGSWDEEDVAKFIARANRIVTAGQRASMTLTDAYVAQSLGRAPLGVDTAPLTRVRESIWRGPFTRLWHGLSEGQSFDEAFAAAQSQVATLAATDVQRAMAHTARWIAQEDDRLIGYQRVANSGACDFCMEIDGAFVKRADAMALHDNCQCGLEPVENPRI